MLLPAFICGKEHATVFAPSYGVEVYGGFNGSPGSAGVSVPDFDDSFIRGENFGFREGVRIVRGRGGGGKEGEGMDRVAIALVFFEKRVG